jgi:dolichyl-diphosphooligosaccharide--protein glycosyltransferase
VVILLCVYPLTGPLPTLSSGAAGGIPILNTINGAVFISDALYETLTWLKNNTPDPFGDPGYYYKRYAPPVKGEDYHYPGSAYGIAALWDYGHMITRIAHRIPSSNPHQRGAGDVAKLFTSQNELLATAIMNTLNARYLIIDTPSVVTKFRGVIAYAGRENGEFFDMYYKTENNRLRGDFYFYPEYYQSLAVRLYNFNNAKVTPQNILVVSYQEKVFPDGEHYREISDSKLFPTYDRAVDFIKTNKSANSRIVGTDPFVSPVPLEPLNNYALVHSSDEASVRPQAGKISEVKVFEYKK